MRHAWQTVLAAVVVVVCDVPSIGQEDARSFDVVIYGGTSAAVAAGVQAARMGHSAAIVCPETRLGGLSSSGLGWTDSGNKAVIGGVAREFYQRIKRHYDDPGAWRWERPEDCRGYRPGDDAMWVFEPHVAEAVFEDLVDEHDVRVFRDRWLDRSGAGVTMEDGRIVAIAMTNGERFAGRVLIDATYEGDLMAAAGVSFTVGRESNDTYGETLNGVQTANAVSHQFAPGVDPFVVQGDPSSGLLPRIHGGSPGEEGAGDHRVQAYNYRLCLTRVPENRVVFPKPEGYDSAQYELLLRALEKDDRFPFRKFDPMPNGKTDTNNHGPFSTDNIGMNYDYPEASYQRRAEILREHEIYQKGYFYFLCNDSRVPEAVRSRMSEWGLAADEFEETGHWPHQIYVREARRMVGGFVVTERHLRGTTPTADPIGMGSYNMDSHNTQRYVAYDEDGRAEVRNEGDIQVSPGGPYPISLGAILPARDECANLLVPVCVSSSHIAYGSIRMEPVFMILGQSAATAAAMAIERGVAVQDVPYSDLRRRLLDDGQVLSAGSGAGPSGAGVDPQTLEGVVIDDTDAELTGAWTRSTSVGGFVGDGYQHDGGDGASSEARFTASVEPGLYDVRVSYTAHANRASNVRVTVESGGHRLEARVDQRVRPAIAGLWTPVGRIEIAPGAHAVVRVGSDGADGYVIADAVQLLPVGRAVSSPPSRGSGTR